MAYEEYNKDSNKYDFDSASKESIDKIDYLKVPIENGGEKAMTRENIIEALSSCNSGMDKENETRFNFWTDALAKADELGVI